MIDEKTQGDDGNLRVKCLVFSRVVGFLTPVEFWNNGKKAEWQDRKVFKLPGVEDERPHLDK